MMREEELLQKFAKENNLSSLEFSWGTNKFRYYISYNTSGEEVHICYDTETEEITSRVL